MATKDNRIKYNLLSGVLYQVVLIALSFLLPRLYLENFGSEVNGVLSTIKQIFVYMLLLESGVGLAATQALYKPVAEKNHNKINSVISATHSYYVKVGVMYALTVLLIALVYEYIIPTGIKPGVVFGIVILTALPQLFSYFFQAKYRILLEVDGRKYVITNSETILQLLSNVAKILVILLTNNLLLMQLSYCILSLLQLLYVYVHAKRRYKWLSIKTQPDYEAISQRKSVLVHQISGMVFNNTDILLLSFLCDFRVVSVYTIYNIFFSQIQTFITSIISGFSFALGQMFHTDRTKFMKVYDVYETFYIMATFVIYTLMAVFLLPLIQIYTKGINDANYTNSLLVILFVVMNLLSNGKLPSNHVLEYSGKFEETRSHAIWEMIINIAVSIVSILKWGICGAILGTIVALLYRGTMMIYYSNRKVLMRGMFHTYKLWIVNGAVFAALMAIFYVDSFSGLSFTKLLIKGIIHSFWIVPLYIGVNYIFFKRAFKNLIELWRNKA
ncbi:MAG: polysaccharide biosynthesis C-terminal domain-containing protein [Oscillospiraceae bacterium]|nr:polysaccharide biosynthesis C-terminal domain-containing protein [Oscillospiraceae bacterium]